MAPGDAWKKMLSPDEMLDNMRIALKDARISTAIPSESDPGPKSELNPCPAPLTTCAVRQPRRPRKSKARVARDDDVDSDGEMRVVCTTDLTGEVTKNTIARQHNRVEKSTAMATKLDVDVEVPKDFGLRQGQEADEDLALIPWKFLLRYAELYVGKTNTPIVKPCFDGDMVFESQIWDFFYLYEPDDLNADPFLFVPTSQLETLLRNINEKHGIALRIPDCAPAKFFYNFGCHSTPRPRYLGRTNLDTKSFKMLLACLPLPDPEDEVVYQASVTQAERDDFNRILKRIKDSWTCSKGEGKSRSKKNAFKRYNNRKAWGHATKRVQRYLGLREKAASVKPLRSELSPRIAFAGVLGGGGAFSLTQYFSD